MAKIDGGLLSFGARGTIGKTVTFSTWKGRNYARQRVIPANPNTVAQQGSRSLFRNGQLFYKESPTLAREPWLRFAQGQPLTDWNAFTGKFSKLLKGETDLSLMQFSPGAKGGLPAISIGAVPTANDITLTFVNPAPPTGWTLTSAQAACVVDGDPLTVTDYSWVADEDDTTQVTVVLSGLTASTPYAVGGWLKWAKPDLSTAYGVSLTQLVTTTA